jgi:hypothetical protein
MPITFISERKKNTTPDQAVALRSLASKSTN